MRNFLFVFIILFSSCSENRGENNFYCQAKADSDVWRVPIIKPFDFITQDTSETWTLSWLPKYRKEYYISCNADSANYERGMIICYSRIGIADFAIVEIKNEKIIKLAGREQFNEFARKNGISNRLYSVPSVFNNWRKTEILPWQSEIIETIKCP